MAVIPSSLVLRFRTTVTPLRTRYPSAVDRASDAGLFCSRDLMQTAESGFRAFRHVDPSDTGNGAMSVHLECGRTSDYTAVPCRPTPCGQSESSAVYPFAFHP